MRSEHVAASGAVATTSEPRARQVARVVALLVLAAALARLLVFPINEHLYGDAVSRTEMAEQWAAAPHLITSFGDGAAQFGPLHLYLVAAALELLDREDASRALSLLFGVLTIVPLYNLSRRYFGDRGALWSGLAFVVWGMHIGLSTTGGSEALSLCLMWVAFAAIAAGLETGRVRFWLLSALAMNLAAATRYDAWMYIPLLAAVPAVQLRPRRRGAAIAAMFALLCLVFPVTWMVGNAAGHGDALYPLTYIDQFHRVWADSTPAGWPRVWLRLQGVGFWPAMALLTLSPGVACFGIIGMVTSWKKRPDTRWLIVAALVPTVYYALRTTLLFNFVPLGRFAVLQLSLLLPFVVPGWTWCLDRRGPVVTRRLVVASAVTALVLPLALGLYTWQSTSVAARVLRPISPTSTNPPDLMRVATFVRREIVERGHTLALDSDAGYLDLQVGFFGRVPVETARMRWPGFRDRVEHQPPEFLVLFADGALAREPWVTIDGSTLTVGGATYDEIGGFDAPARIFRR